MTLPLSTTATARLNWSSATTFNTAFFPFQNNFLPYFSNSNARFQRLAPTTPLTLTQKATPIDLIFGPEFLFQE
jgi:hypothetical protein